MNAQVIEAMEKHYRYSDDVFEQKFATCKLPAQLFTHDAHLRLAWVHISKYGVDQAIDNITAQIKAFADYHKVSNNYHATITVAAIRAVHHFMLKTAFDSFPDFLAHYPQLKQEFRALISSHYSIDIFKSTKARASYLEPDLIPFD